MTSEIVGWLISNALFVEEKPVNTRQSCVNTWENIDIQIKSGDMQTSEIKCVFVRCVKFSSRYLTPDSKSSSVWQREASSASTLQSKQTVTFKEVSQPWWEIAALANYVVFVFLPCGNFSAQLMSKSELIVARKDEVISQGNLKENEVPLKMTSPLRSESPFPPPQAGMSVLLWPNPAHVAIWEVDTEIKIGVNDQDRLFKVLHQFYPVQLTGQVTFIDSSRGS